tara:strand:- start:63 stop:770 length:708 start_codon:yes stop_codon:yes gene_type:complete
MNPDVLIIAGGSASGKSTVVKELMGSRIAPHLATVLTTTTRAKREGEADNAYNFLTTTEFREGIDKGKFIEFDMVNGNFYGLQRDDLQSSVQKAREVGGVAIVILTPPGAMAAKNFLSDSGVHSVATFIDCPHEQQIVRLVSRFISEKRQLESAGGEPSDVRGLADTYADRLTHVKEVENKWGVDYDWDYKINNGEGRQIRDLVDEIQTIISINPESPAIEKAAVLESSRTPGMS